MFYIELYFGGVWFAGRAALLPARQPRAFRSVSGSVPDCQASKLRGISLLPSLRGRVRICCYAASQPASQPGPSLRPSRISSSNALPSIQHDGGFLFSHPDLEFLHSRTPPPQLTDTE